ncbi:hypothetical protein CCO03_09930 [Comamonas serinivorans]|uniref:Knr4/Smi1-like domain-containing protein n=2 Tax=Comamonas serinivorans TaxID=1082851 RepID=A0A1Y0EMZ6_9BURK|nr:hypothetical protein CCO03_09930 [Comamonas serinivorans]
MGMTVVDDVRRFLADFDARVGGPARVLWPHTACELDAAEAALGMRLPLSYRRFLGEFGGCWAGLDVYGLRNDDLLQSTSMVELTREFLDDGWPLPRPCCVFSIDGAGNPIYFDAVGQVCLFDHDLGQASLLAPDFDALMRDVLT